MTKIKFLIVSLLWMLASIVLFVVTGVTLFLDSAYIDSLNLPTNADSVLIPIMGIILWGPVLLFVSTVIIVILWLVSRRNRPAVTIRLIDFLPRKNEHIALKVTKYALLAVLCGLFLTLLYYWRDYATFTEVLFFGSIYFFWSSIILVFLVWLTAIVTQNTDGSENNQ